MSTHTHENLTIRQLSADSVWDYENGWHWFSAPTRMAKLLAHYEIYKRCVHLPGCVAEFGVYKGNSLLQMATFRHMLELPEARKIYTFDAFGTFPTEDIQNPDDQDFIARFSSDGGDGSSLEEIQSILDFKGFKNIHLIKGDVRKTFPNFLKENPHTRFNLIHLDMDVYEPTKVVLSAIYDKLVKGGIIMIDDYNAVVGATNAIDEFIAAHPELSVEKLPTSHIPAFIVKK